MPLQLLDTRNSSAEETVTFENANDTRLETIMHNQTRLYGIDIARLASSSPIKNNPAMDLRILVVGRYFTVWRSSRRNN